MKNFSKAIFLFCLVFANHAFGISFDKLSDVQQLIVSGTTTSYSSTLNPASQALGGSRFVALSKGNSGTTVFVGIGPDFNNVPQLDHSQNANTTGSSLYVWDGDPAAGVQFTGLGGVNFQADGATALKITITSFDLPFGAPINIYFNLYDASDPTGLLKASRGTLTISSAISSPTVFTIPFTSLQPLAPQQVSLNNIGAVTMLIDGTSSPDADLQVAFIGTNGSCDHVPVNKLVVDQCNVCNGDNSSCSDCVGTPNGLRKAGTSCTTGQPGVCSAGTYSGHYPSCSCNRLTPPTSEICDGLDNNCDGRVDENNPTTGPRVDVCGICGGDGKSCLDCKGTPNGIAKFDQCNVCGGDNSSCSDCNGVPNGPAKFDQCNVCGGDNSSCSDCKGVVNGTAVVDACGVCDGNGISCCTATDLTSTLASLDSGAKEQELIIGKAGALLAKLINKNSTTTKVNKVKVEAHTLQIRNWTLSWTVPITSTTCSHTVACATRSNSPMITEYRTNNERLKKIAVDLFTQINRARKGKKSTLATSAARQVASLSKWSERVFTQNLKLTFSVPETQLLCSGGTTLSDIR